MKCGNNFYRDYEKLSSENVKLKERIFDYQEKNRLLEKNLKRTQKSKEDMKIKYEVKLEEKEAIIKELSVRLAKAEALQGRDGTNTGTPTSQTPINKKKTIPNSRRSTGKKKSGQVGHKKHTMAPLESSDVNDWVSHEIGEDDVCSRCGSLDWEDTGKVICKDELDVEINVVKRRHEFHVYRCLNCGAEFHVPINKRLKEANQYGSTIQAIALSLMDTGNVPVNKVKTIISGITEEQLDPSEGFISKLQSRASAGLDEFTDDLRLELIKRRVVYWDDTVIMIMKSRGCLRFYRDETIALYAAHMHKDIVGLDEDNILQLLTNDTYVMHDHNKVNYNEKYCYQNLECNQHLQRDCQKNSQDTMHEWSTELKEFISGTIKERKDAIEHGESSFSSDYLAGFNKRLDEILVKADQEHIIE